MVTTTDNPRIIELRRRLEKDPSSIAFAQLAEECRRVGEIEEAVRVSQDGLAKHPGYVSAQVTLGRALIALGRFDEARVELEAVRAVAPENLAALRALADIHQAIGDRIEAVPTVEPQQQPEFAPPLVSPEEARTAVDAERIADTPAPALGVLERWLAAIVADRARAR